MTQVTSWEHVVQYYETDQMQIVHHSNYLRWFEEARTWMMTDMGYSYQMMEAAGIMVPVLGAQAEYKSMVKFGETVYITAKVAKFNGVRMTLSYEVRDRDSDELRCTGATSHAFLHKDTYRPMSLKRTRPEIYQLFLKEMIAEN